MSDGVTLASFKTALAAGITTVLDAFGVKDVQTFHGRFTPDTLRKFGASAPAARVTSAALSAPHPDDAPIIVPVRFTVYLITKDMIDSANNNEKVGRDIVMDNLVQCMVQNLQANTWGGVQGAQPTGIEATNLYSDDQAGLAVLLWAVSWVQELALDLVPDPTAALLPLEEIDSTVDAETVDGGTPSITGKQPLAQS